MSLLEVRNLSRAFGGLQALSDVSFDLKAGEMTAMIGPNGAGKSTCFNILFGLLRPDAGSVRFDGHELTGLPTQEIWRLGVGRTFQITETFGSMTVRENVQMALISRHRASFRLWPPARRLFVSEADAMLQSVGLLDQAGRVCATLAYGDVKRLELAIALAHEPRLLLMDEPTAGMAAAERQELMRLLAGIVETRGLTVLFTEHDMDIVFGYARRIMVLNRGRIIADGPGEKVRADEKVRDVYLGGGGVIGQTGGDDG